MLNDRIGLSGSVLAEIKQTAGAYGIEEQPFTETKKGGVYTFKHPGHPRKSDWIFVLDWHWNKHWVRFHRRFIDKIPAELIVDVEKKKGGNFSVRYEDLEKARVLPASVRDCRWSGLLV